MLTDGALAPAVFNAAKLIAVKSVLPVIVSVLIPSTLEAVIDSNFELFVTIKDPSATAV